MVLTFKHTKMNKYIKYIKNKIIHKIILSGDNLLVWICILCCYSLLYHTMSARACLNNTLVSLMIIMINNYILYNCLKKLKTT